MILYVTQTTKVYTSAPLKRLIIESIKNKKKLTNPGIFQSNHSTNVRVYKKVQQELKQPHFSYTQKTQHMHQITWHSCLPEQCNHCDQNFSRKSSLSKHMLVVHGASRPSKILQDRYLAKLMQKDQLCHLLHRLQD